MQTSPSRLLKKQNLSASTPLPGDLFSFVRLQGLRPPALDRRRVKESGWIRRLLAALEDSDCIHRDWVVPAAPSRRCHRSRPPSSTSIPSSLSSRPSRSSNVDLERQSPSPDLNLEWQRPPYCPPTASLDSPPTSTSLWHHPSHLAISSAGGATRFSVHMCDVIAVQVGRRTYMPCLQVPFPTANGRKEKIASSLLSPFVATSRQLKSRSPAEATPSYSSRIRRPGTMIHQGHHCEVHPTHWGFGSVR